MKINKLGLQLIKDFEGCKLETYRDIVGVKTIGYGCTENVQDGMKITQEQAEDMLLKELARFELGVSRLVISPITENQFAALVSLSYNVGLSNFATSTLLRKLNSKDYAGASEQFVRWNKAGGEVVAGLTRRRLAEKELFLKA